MYLSKIFFEFEFIKVVERTEKNFVLRYFFKLNFIHEKFYHAIEQ